MPELEKKTPLAALAAAALLISASACTSTPRGSQNRYEGSENVHETKAIEGNTILARDLKINNYRSRREGGRLVVEFDLENQRTGALDFAWAVDWLDAQGFRVDAGTRHWEPASLGGKGVTTLSIVAPTPAATGWRLQVTSPDEVR